MNAVINPNVLFITDEEWQDEELRDLFLEKTLNLLKYIESNNNIFLYWNNEYEELLWEAPQQKPWRRDKDWNNPLIPILYNYFSNPLVIEDAEDACLYDKTDTVQKSKQRSVTLRMMHFCIKNEETVYFITDCNTPDNEMFRCSCHRFQEIPKIVRKISDFHDVDSLITDFWPRNRYDKKKLHDLISYVSALENGDKVIRNEYDFSDGFMQEILTKQIRKKRMVVQIVKRLQMTEEEARVDSTLHDEYIDTVKERRMRITGEPTSIRVHYRYGENHKIIFVHYYQEGEHDVGL